MNIARHAILVTLATSFSIPAIAEEQSPIIVTATRTAQTVDETLASVTVITKEQIQQQQADDLAGLLASVSGIDMVSNGGLGKTTSILMRGTASKHTLVMIDGIQVGSATLGSVAFENIPLSQVERIEIVRGPRSSLYGSNAIGGIIQIFTKQGEGAAKINAEVGYGSNNLSKASAGLSGKRNKTSYSFNASHLKTDGINTLENNDIDEDGYDNTSFSANIKHSFSNTSSLAVNFLHATGTNEYDNEYVVTDVMASDFTQQSGGITFTSTPLKNWELILKAGKSQDKNENFKNSVDDGIFITDRDKYSLQNNITLSDSLILTAGIDYQNDKVSSSTTTYDKSSRYNTGYFIQQQWIGDKNSLTAALRVDDNQAFDKNTTGNIAWAYDFENKTKLITSYGTAFNAPTFNQLYYPGYGVSTLKPEKSESVEIEVRNKHSWGDVSISLYNTKIQDMIPAWPVANINKAEINGVELRLKTTIYGWITRTELSLLNPKDQDTGKILLRRSKEMLRIDMDKTAGKWSTGMSFIGQGYRYDDAANTDRINGYGIINLRASYAISKKLSVKWKIDNLLDKKYETAKNYNNPGITGFVSLVYQGI